MASLDAELEQSLLSLEKLDRASPDLWPEQIPGLSEFAAIQSPQKNPDNTYPKWLQNFDNEDVNLLQEFGSLTVVNLIEEVRKLQNLAYQLGLEEAKEVTRGRYLHILEFGEKMKR
ncbi:Protein lin-52 [Chamberlinius hualienensis]